MGREGFTVLARMVKEGTGKGSQVELGPSLSSPLIK